MFIIKNKKIFIGISIVLIIFSIVSISIFRLKVGIDFKGGALTEVVYKDARPDQAELNSALGALNFGSILLQPTGDMGYIVKSRDLNEAEHGLLLKTLSQDGKNILEEKSFNSIGPSVGRELTKKAIIAIILVSLAIILFIAYAFRKVSKPVSSWRYGLIAVVSLLHDVTIPIGLFAILSHYYGAELDTLFVVAALTILGLSVSDTIVIFDKIREYHKEQGSMDSETAANQALTETMVRSLNNSMTIVFMLLSLTMMGGSTIRFFIMTLLIGTITGTYSSPFVATPILVWLEKHRNK